MILSRILSAFRRFQARSARIGKAIAPGQRAWRGAAIGVIVGAVFFTAIVSVDAFAPAGWLALILGFLALLAVAAVVVGLTWLSLRLLNAFPTAYEATLAGAFLLLGLAFLSMNPGSLVVMAAILVVSSLLGAGTKVLLGGGWATATRIQRGIIATALGLGLVGLAGGGIWLFYAGSPATLLPNGARLAQADIATLTAPDPSLPGDYTVNTLFYGSGEDRRRPEYGPEVAMTTPPVDGSPLLEGWSDLRTKYWGFGPEALPLNARVWYPEGAGPFPLVLIVHGNHFMEDFSDPGYEYLGQLLAGQGFIFASVDENFLNSSPASDLVMINGLKEESDARGWVLLEHLRQWRSWNATPGNPFYQKVDLKNIALIGHSRGGEAVAIAAAFNRLPCYPDDGAVAFDYDFNIRTLVAIAPVDGQYLPADKPTPLENVNYLVLHGVHDMDVTSFSGAKAYQRVRFTDGQFWVKAALYIYGANHGQFNTVWGRKDTGEPGIRMFNLKQLLPPEDQRQIAKVAIAAFLKATLNGDKRYLPLFRDYRTAPGWLPDTVYLSQYSDSTCQRVATYEDDINLATTTLPGGAIRGEHLTIWREQAVTTKWGDMGISNAGAAYLGWSNSPTQTVAASYAITLPPGLALDADSILTFALADANEAPNPKGEDAKKGTGEKKDKSEEEDRRPLDLTLEAVDQHGVVARLPLSHYALLQPQIEGVIAKAAWMGKPQSASEIVFQNFEFPLADFVEVAPAFDPAGLVAVRFVFDRTEAGVVVLDDFGFRQAE
ncbi:MAG: MFS transporter [Anaerolineae bacterium]|nr:MFS transporter [Anaerolineae bacterium]